MKKAIVLDTHSSDKFTEDLEKYLNEGYTLESSSIGVIQSEEYDFCSSYQALLVKHNDPQKTQEG